MAYARLAELRQLTRNNTPTAISGPDIARIQSTRDPADSA
jgi:hypothetical protein